MTRLAKRFPKLAMVPHVPLARPTAVEPLRGLVAELGGELWVKRDDRTSDRYGGNKVRKLEFLLGDARRQDAKALVTAGAWGSHHVLATSLFGQQWGFEVHAVMVPQPRNEHVDENLRVDLAVGAQLHPVRSWPAVVPTMRALMLSLDASGKAPYRVAYGGSSSVGALGYVETGLEIAAQIDAGECPEPEAIYCAMGSGGTAAGLAIGLAAAGLTTRVRAVRVTPRLVCNRATVATLVANTVRRIRKQARSFPAVVRAAISAIEIDHDHVGAGYGAADPRAQEATRLAARDDLHLDPTYTARAFARFTADARHASRPLMFLHTLSRADLSPLLEGAPPVPAFAQ